MCWPSAEPGRHYVAALDPATYRRHVSHGGNRVWSLTNGYTDLLQSVAIDCVGLTSAHPQFRRIDQDETR